jgi:membrane protein DedA with SNARE-associated domain
MLEVIVQYLEAISNAPVAWKLSLIFFFMAVESSFIPFPSEVVMIPAGFLASRGELGFASTPILAAVVAVLLGTAGSLAGAYFNYYLARGLGEPFLRKYGKWFFLKPEVLDRASEIFNRYGAETTFVCRLVPVVRQVISVPAGVAKMPILPFSFFTGLGAGIWSAILAASGYLLGMSSSKMGYAELVHKGKDAVSANLIWIILGAAVLAAGYMAICRLVMKGKKCC